MAAIYRRHRWSRLTRRRLSVQACSCERSTTNNFRPKRQPIEPPYLIPAIVQGLRVLLQRRAHACAVEAWPAWRALILLSRSPTEDMNALGYAVFESRTRRLPPPAIPPLPRADDLAHAWARGSHAAPRHFLRLSEVGDLAGGGDASDIGRSAGSPRAVPLR